jgi:small basic protein (TIGR04137 family)
MSIDRSLKLKGALARHRNVLTRAERVERLKEEERWEEGDNLLGLPKVANRKVSVGKKKAEAKPTVEGAVGDQAAGAEAAATGKTTSAAPGKGAAPGKTASAAGGKGAAPGKTAPAAGGKGAVPGKTAPAAGGKGAGQAKPAAGGKGAGQAKPAAGGKK